MASATPTIDKARDEELTSGEIILALKELGSLNPDESRPFLTMHDGRATIAWPLRRQHRRSCSSPEDAIIEAADELIEWRAAEERIREEEERQERQANGQFGVGA